VVSRRAVDELACGNGTGWQWLDDRNHASIAVVYEEPGPRMYDVSRDDLRFLMIKQSTTTNEPATSARLILVQHWLKS
jgi:hypothetical protein